MKVIYNPDEDELRILFQTGPHTILDDDAELIEVGSSFVFYDQEREIVEVLVRNASQVSHEPQSVEFITSSEPQVYLKSKGLSDEEVDELMGGY